MEKIKLTAKEAHKLARILGIDIDDDATTFYAADAEKTEIWSFETRTERNHFVNKK